MSAGTVLKEWTLLIASVAFTLLLGLAGVRWLAPGLLRTASEVRIVQVDERVVPFYEGVFRAEHREGRDPMLDDPTVVLRARPFLPAGEKIGPNDALGFRNQSIPDRPRVISIGDSQTYGTGVPIDAAWPHVLARRLGDPQAVYDMSTGGWGAVQYLLMWEFASFFQPEVVVIAFYTGNDSRDAFSTAYSVERFAHLRPDPTLHVDDLPPVRYPPPLDERWMLQFGGGPTLTLTPALRLGSNLEHPAVAAGWEIMARVAETILEEAAQGGPRPVFTILPTKERAFEKRLRASGVRPQQAYEALVAGEAGYTNALADRIRAAGGELVDVVGPLQQAAVTSLDLYPSDFDGHMAAPGHAIVADLVHARVAPLLARSEGVSTRSE